MDRKQILKLLSLPFLCIWLMGASAQDSGWLARSNCLTLNNPLTLGTVCLNYGAGGSLTQGHFYEFNGSGLPSAPSSWDDKTGGGAGSGTVTQVDTANGLTGGPITTSGTVSGVNAAADGATKGVAAFATNDFDAATGVISLDYTNGQKASGSQSGFLSSTDWTTFNNKQAAGSYLTGVTADSPLSGSGTSGSHLVIGNAAADGTTKGAASFTANDFNATSGNISLDYTNGQKASASLPGFLSSTDWSTFNAKQAAGNYITALTGDVTASGPGSVAAMIANSAVTLAKIQNAAASSKLLGSGATGSGSPYAEITLGTNLSMSGTTLNASGGGGTGCTTSGTSILQGDGAGGCSNVTVGSGLNFTGGTLTSTGAAPDSAHYVTTQAESGLSAEFNLGGLTSGLLKQTVSGGVATPAIATAGTDYPAPGGAGCTSYVAPGTNVIQAAIDALPDAGGTVCLGAGTYTQTTAIVLGNGTSSAISTKNGMLLTGVAIPTSNGYQTFASPAATVIDCTGTTDGNCIDVNGPVEGWGLQNVRLTGVNTGTTSYGIYVRGGRFGGARNIDIVDFKEGIFLSTWSTWTGPGTMFDSLLNSFDNIQITLTAGATRGLHLDGQAASPAANADFNHLKRIHVHMIGINATCVELGWSDNNHIEDLTCGGGGASAKGLVFNYGALSIGPANNYITGFDPALDPIQNNGSPGGSAKNNYLILSEANGATCPGLANLIVYGCSTVYFNNMSVRGTLAQTGSASGAVTQQVQAAAGTWNWNWPTSAGSSGQPLLSAGGGSSAMTWGTLGVGAGGTGLTSGTSGGVLAYTASGTLASSGALTANLPVIGGGAGATPSVGTRSGNTTEFVTTTGTQTSGHCVSIDANGNHVDSGGACGSGSTMNGARAFNSANLSIPDNAVTALTLDSERFDNGGLHSTVTNTSRLTFPSACVAVVTVNIQWDSSSTGVRSLLIRLNGATSIGAQVQNPVGTSAFQMSVSTIYSFATNDYIEAAVYQSSGGALNILNSGNESPEVSAQCITQ